MNHQEQVLKRDIMKRVRFIFAVKRVTNLVAPKIAVLAGLVVVASFFVSIPNVVRNMPSLLELGRLFEFGTAAFLNTKLAIQAISVGTLMLVFYILRDIVKTFRGQTGTRSLGTV